MIRKFEKPDINSVAEIWLDTNIKAHSFISQQYWRNNLELVKESLNQAEVYVFDNEKKILGFIGLDDNYIAGIFVQYKEQSNGIGKQLLDYVKGIKNHLSLKVYKRNVRAVEFYLRESFAIQCEIINESTCEMEYLMTWSRN